LVSRPDTAIQLHKTKSAKATPGRAAVVEAAQLLLFPFPFLSPELTFEL